MTLLNEVNTANNKITSSSSSHHSSEIDSSSDCENNYDHKNVFSSAETKKKIFNNWEPEVPKLLKGLDSNKDQSYFLSMTQVTN